MPATADPVRVVHSFILAMMAWTAKGSELFGSPLPEELTDADIRRIEAVTEEYWAEHARILNGHQTPRARAYTRIGEPIGLDFQNEVALIAVAIQKPARTEITVRSNAATCFYEHKFIVLRNGVEWRIDNLKYRRSGDERWIATILV